MTQSVRELLEANVDADDYHIGGGVPARTIALAENALAVQFPAEYREFVGEVGWLEIHNSYFFGVPADPESEEGNVVHMTRYARNHWALPENYLVVYSSDDQALWCLDGASAERRSKVLAFDTRRTEFAGTVSASYFDALSDFLTA
ncbi:SMI1/KNR4 family protein [Tahibacter sp.]|uniref:SMI1/KNR4 family protein n=1 Tax=Tahibacter sp. TaxID=2056211 RepID=UPI0028C4A198|nr:SMI1/KNR4 family protein [Tahibacter sp.]